MIILTDDILVYCNSEVEHTKPFRTVLSILKDKKLYSKVSKNEIYLCFVAIFGYVMSKKHIWSMRPRFRIFEIGPNLLYP